jgi:hypothetical protein
LIAGHVVEPDERADELAPSTEAGLMNEPDSPRRRVPPAAYLAADSAFEGDDEGSDELARALSAADPYIRMDEIDRHLPTLSAMGSVAEIVRYLTGQRDLLALFTE